ncbi:hypothetical protein PspLS_08166 [Pyricularia sp. CBS 133598]|nr:hypothetical protein PspLS_08166 [Pyricularia sp. CBS 133598]
MKQEKGKEQAEPELWTQSLVVHIFRGEPDSWNNRHVLLYLESAQNPNFHETLHVQRLADEIGKDKDDKQMRSKEKMRSTQRDGLPWKLDRFNKQVNWTDSVTYIKHLHAGLVYVDSQYEEQVADIIASQPVPNHSVTDQNCQTWLMGAMNRLVEAGLQTQEWYDWFEEELINLLMDGSVDEVPGM